MNYIRAYVKPKTGALLEVSQLKEYVLWNRAQEAK